MSLYQENSIYVNNSLSGKTELFVPLNAPHVGMYVCGPTVYSDVHLGNCRTFISFDMVYRYLKFLGYKVRYVRNITDAGHLENDADEGEDKIAKKARVEQLEPMEIVQRYTVDFHNIMAQFNAFPPSIEPTATGHIIEQIAMIEEIIATGKSTRPVLGVVFDDLTADTQAKIIQRKTSTYKAIVSFRCSLQVQAVQTALQTKVTRSTGHQKFLSLSSVFQQIEAVASY